MMKKNCLAKNITAAIILRPMPVNDWVQCWQQVVEGVFCCDGVFAPVAPLKVYSHLVKLVAAAHLVNVREVMHVEDAQRKKHKVALLRAFRAGWNIFLN